MLASKIDQWGMQQALAKINERKYNHNIGFRFLEQGRKVHFRLIANSYDHIGFRITHGGFCHPSGCWHAHGDFFDAVFEVAPDAMILSAGGGDGLIKITKDEGNWQDRNIGSKIYPFMFSESCFCNIRERMNQYFGKDDQIQSFKDFKLRIKELPQSMIEELMEDQMRNWHPILIRNCSYEVLQSGLFQYDRSGFMARDYSELVEVQTVKKCPKKELPLFIGALKTAKGQAALDRRLKRC